MHLAYLGFGIFLQLVQYPPLNPQVNILGTVCSDPKTLQQFVVKSELSGTMGQPTAETPSAATGSAAQLQRVEDELKQTRNPWFPTKPKPEPVDLTSTKPATSTKPRPDKMLATPQVNIKPFQVILKKKLMAEEIQQHTKRALIPKTADKQALVSVSIKLHKLLLAPNQSHSGPTQA